MQHSTVGSADNSWSVLPSYGSKRHRNKHSLALKDSSPSGFFFPRLQGLCMCHKGHFWNSHQLLMTSQLYKWVIQGNLGICGWKQENALCNSKAPCYASLTGKAKIWIKLVDIWIGVGIRFHNGKGIDAILMKKSTWRKIGWSLGYLNVMETQIWPRFHKHHFRQLQWPVNQLVWPNQVFFVY